MRITRQDASELQLEDSGLGMVAFGIIFLVAAVACAGMAINEGKVAAAVIVLGGFGSAGMLILRRARASVHHFDLQRGILTVETRPALAADDQDRVAVTYPLTTLADIVLEESDGADGGRTHTRMYRPVYRFQDGTRLPLRPNYVNELSGQLKIQAAVRAILPGLVAKRA